MDTAVRLARDIVGIQAAAIGAGADLLLDQITEADQQIAQFLAVQIGDRIAERLQLIVFFRLLHGDSSFWAQTSCQYSRIMLTHSVEIVKQNRQV